MSEIDRALKAVRWLLDKDLQGWEMANDTLWHKKTMLRIDWNPHLFRRYSSLYFQLDGNGRIYPTLMNRQRLIWDINRLRRRYRRSLRERTREKRAAAAAPIVQKVTEWAMGNGFLNFKE